MRSESVRTGDGWTCASERQTVRCTLPGDLAVASTAVRLIVRVDAALGSTIENRARVAGPTEVLDQGARRPGRFADPQRVNDRSVATAVVESNNAARGLAFTGRDAARFATIGTLLVLLGGALVTGTSRRRRTTS